MVNILLCCSAGMSTSLMVSKMQASAEERGIEATIWAVPEAEAQANAEKADVILLGPQVRFLLDKVKSVAGDTPVEVIDMMAYGMMDGAKVLDQGLKLIGQRVIGRAPGAPEPAGAPASVSIRSSPHFFKERRHGITHGRFHALDGDQVHADRAEDRQSASPRRHP